MSVLYAIIIGIIQGITEFLPVSSSGHVILLERIFKFEPGPGFLFLSMLHLGTLFAVATVFRKDIVQVVRNILSMLIDLVGNVHRFIHNKRTGEKLSYTRVVSSSSRKFAALILVSSVPTFLLGYTSRRLVAMTVSSAIMYGVGFLITGIMLLVVDLSKNGGEKTMRETEYSNAMWIGICQGISAFPGISRCGLTVSAGLLGGLSRSLAVKYSYLISIPAILGSFISQLGNFGAVGMTFGTGAGYFLGMIVAGITGYFSIRFLLRLTVRMKLRYFAYYCFFAGIFSLALEYLF